MPFFSDLRLAVRSLLRTPGFVLSVVAILALGIGTVTAVFGMLDQVALQPLAARDAGRWTHLVKARPDGSVASDLSYPLFRLVRDQTAVFDALVAHVSLTLTLGDAGAVERIDAAGVTAGSFHALDIPLLLGRDFASDEDRPGAAAPVVVLGHGLWERRFGGDSAIVGKPVRLNGESYTVIGVAPPGFLGMVRGVREEAWIPVTATHDAGENAFTRTTVSWLDVLGRLAPGISRTSAIAQLNARQPDLVRDGYVGEGTRLELQDGSRGLTALVGALEQPLRILLAASVLVLLIACANLAGLWLARTAARHRQLSIRLALGASRLSLARLLLAEGLVLALAGGLAGLLVSQWLGALAPPLHTLFGAPLALAGSDHRIPVFVAAAILLATALMVLGPALWTSGLRLGGSMREGAPTADRVGGRNVLVVVQVTLAVVLVSGAVLFGLTARRIAAVNPGYVPEGVLMASADAEAAGEGLNVSAFWQNTLQRLRSDPAVASASLALTVTPSPGGSRFDGVPLEGVTLPVNDIGFDVNTVGPEYFETMGIPLLSGRGFGSADTRGSARVVVVNRELVRRYFGGVSPLGRHVWLSGDTAEPGAEIIGVVPDGKYRSLREAPLPVLYRAALQSPPLAATLLVRARSGTVSAALGETIRRAVREADPRIPVYGIQPLEEQLRLARSTESLLAYLASLYGVLALVLAAVGLFGLLSYSVARRTREIGVRVALGAQPFAIRGLVVRQGLARAVVGLVCGLVLTAALGQILRARLFEVAPLDARVLGGVAVVVLAVAVAASWWPAARAARVDPVVALREE